MAARDIYMGARLFWLYEEGYRINWLISTPFVARARQMPSLRREFIAKGFTIVHGLCAIQILLRPFHRRRAYKPGGLIAEGGPIS
jgi:hypothetical protein